MDSPQPPSSEIGSPCSVASEESLCAYGVGKSCRRQREMFHLAMPRRSRDELGSLWETFQIKISWSPEHDGTLRGKYVCFSETPVVDMEQPSHSRHDFRSRAARCPCFHTRNDEDERRKLGPDCGREMALHPQIHIEAHSIPLSVQMGSKSQFRSQLDLQN